MDPGVMGSHHVHMAKRRTGPGHYLREWREVKGLTLEQVVEKVELLGAERADESDPLSTPIKLTHASLSRIERGKQPYNQRLLELLSEIYGAPEGVLLNVRPVKGQEEIWSIWEGLSAPQRAQAVAVLEAIKKTGT